MNIRKLAAAVAVGSTDEVLNVVVESFEELGLTIKNNTANALDAFEIHAKMHKDGPTVPIATVAGDLSTPLWPLRRADALVTLAGNATGKLFMNVAGIHTLIIKASCAGSVTNLDFNGQVT